MSYFALTRFPSVSLMSIVGTPQKPHFNALAVDKDSHSPIPLSATALLVESPYTSLFSFTFHF